MDIQAYIESGILELYVMDALTAQEAAEVESYAAQYPEIQQEIDTIRNAAGTYIAAQASTPPAHIRQRVMQEISSKKEESTSGNSVSFRPGATLKYAAIAASVSLVVSLGFNYIQYASNRQLQEKLVQQSKDIETLNNDYNKVYTAFYQLDSKMEMMADPDNKMVHLKGMKNDDRATILWNPENKEVHLAIDQLASAPDGMQYQLWAIVDDQPVDLGVFNTGMKSYEMLKMKDIQNASAFAVTIEKMGGSPTPNLEMMWLMGAV